MSDKRSMSGLASLVRSKGRGDDTMLIHMTPGEVHGLQRLALAHGGSLTINPDTGLPEAGFLKSLLPALIGFGLSFIPGVGPLAAAGIVGAGETIRTKGDLGKGLMAGLGAFGGAGLGAGLTAAGTAANAANAGAGVGGTGGGALAGFVSGGAQAAQAATQAAATEAAKQGAFATMGQGAKALATEAGRNAFVGAIPGGMKGVMAGGMGLAGAMTPQQKIPGVEDVNSPYWQSYGYDEDEGRFLGGQWLPEYPGMPKKKKKGYADGGLASLAGQPIPHMGQKIPPQDNMYPLSVAAPRMSGTGMPQRREMFSGYSADVDPFTGEERFAAGGPTGMSNPNQPMTPQPQSTPSFEYMPIDPALAQPNSAKAGWMEFMQQNPAEQQRFIDAGYPAEFFQQNPQTFTGQRPFIPGKDEELRSAEIARLNLSPSAMPQYQSGRGSLSNYMQDLNRFLVSPVQQSTPAANPPITPDPPGRPGRPGGPGGPRNPVDDRDLWRPGPGGPRGPQYPIDGRDAWRPNRGGPADDTYFSDEPPPTYEPPTNPFEPPAYEPPAYEPPGRPGLRDMEDFLVYPGGSKDFYEQQSPFAPPTQPDVTDHMMRPPNLGSADMEIRDDPASYMPEIRDPEDFYAPPPPPAKLKIEDLYAPPPPVYEPPPPVRSPFEEDFIYTPRVPSGKGTKFAAGGIAQYAAGGSPQYAAGGKFLRGPGDGMSDDIRANIEGSQEARLADGEFVIPADVVSHLGNGSSEAGSRRLYAMMDRVRKARTGREKQAPEINPERYLPA